MDIIWVPVLVWKEENEKKRICFQFLQEILSPKKFTQKIISSSSKVQFRRVQSDKSTKVSRTATAKSVNKIKS